jgi:hypothetical protein
VVRFIINRFEQLDDRIGIFPLIHVRGRFNAIVNIVKNDLADFSQLTLCRINETKFGVVLIVFYVILQCYISISFSHDINSISDRMTVSYVF